MQSKKHSFLEACVSTAIGFAVAFITNIVVLPLFGFYATLAQNFWITCIFTVVSVARGYGVRRLFNWMHGQGVL